MGLSSIVALACAGPAIADRAGEGTVAADEEELRLVVGKLRGIKQADEDRPVRLAVRAEGAALATVHVVLRNDDGEVVGRSKRFALAEGQRKDARIEVDGPLPLGRYVARATGRTG